MSELNRTLSLWINDHCAAYLYENTGIWSLSYTQSWLDNPKRFSLAPQLPLSAEPIVDDSTHRHVQWFFDNLLPEEASRKLIADNARIEINDAFSLLTHYGAESAGAITLLTDQDTPKPGVVIQLKDADISQRIKNLPKVPLQANSHKKMSLAGAQHKLPVVYRDEKLYEPTEGMPSSHILKPAHQTFDEYPSTVVNEYLIMKLAKEVGLDVPNVHMRFVPEPIYLIERFDRIGQYPNQRRCHVIDGCQMLGLFIAAKYRQSNAESLAQLIQMSISKAKTRIRLFNWAMFNYLIGNTDAHLKNLSFFVTANGFELTPHYDLLCTLVYPTRSGELDDTLSQPMDTANNVTQVNLDSILFFANQLGLNDALAKRQLSKMTKSILPAFSKLYQSIEQTQYPNGALKQSDLRLLRDIQHRVINESLARIGAEVT